LILINQGSSFRPFEVVAFDRVLSQFYSLVSDTDGGRDCRVVSAAGFAYILRVSDSGGGALLNSLLRFDPRHFTLTSLTPCRRLRLDPAAAAVDRHIYLFGGSVDTPSQMSGDSVLDAVDRYSLVDDRWTEVSGLPHPLHSQAAVAVGDRVYISGGVTESLPLRTRSVTADVIRFNTNDDTFECCAPMHCARRLHSLVVLADKNTLYAVGGIGDHHSFHQQTQMPVERYNISTDQWTLLNSSTLAGRSVGHFAVLEGDVIVSVGREHHQATEDDIWRYDIQQDSWSPFIKAPPRTSLASSSCVLLPINFYDDKITKLAKRLVVDHR
jgi:N-acetylneuraminic acid mutarotase